MGKGVQVLCWNVNNHNCRQTYWHCLEDTHTMYGKPVIGVMLRYAKWSWWFVLYHAL